MRTMCLFSHVFVITTSNKSTPSTVDAPGHGADHLVKSPGEQHRPTQPKPTHRDARASDQRASDLEQNDLLGEYFCGPGFLRFVSCEWKRFVLPNE